MASRKNSHHLLSTYCVPGTELSILCVSADLTLLFWIVQMRRRRSCCRKYVCTQGDTLRNSKFKPGGDATASPGENGSGLASCSPQTQGQWTKGDVEPTSR